MTPDDLAAIHELWTHSEVRRFLFDGRCVGIEESRSFLEASHAGFRERSYGLWAAFARNDGAPIGFAGLLHSTAGAPNLIVGTPVRVLEKLGMTVVPGPIEEPRGRRRPLPHRVPGP